MSIATPEGLVLDLVLAGVGSRFIASMLDGLVRTVAFVLLLVAGGMSGALGDYVPVLVLLGIFVLTFVYDVAFELLAGGRTPGKRWCGLRVVTTSGGAVGAGASVVRNLLRVVDFIPGAYLLAIVLVMVTPRHQRLGDLVGGTLVVRERRQQAQDALVSLPPEVQESLLTWDVSAVTADDVVAVRRFLERRTSLEPQARRRLAEQLATRLRQKVVYPEDPSTPEAFLVDLVQAKSQRG